MNAAHPFYEKVYRPLMEAALAPKGDETEDETGTFAEAGSVLTGLQLTLMSLGRAQASMSDNDGERDDLLNGLRTKWSEALATQLKAR